MGSNSMEADPWEAAAGAVGTSFAVKAEPRIPRGAWLEPAFAWLTRLSAITVMVVLAAIFVVLLVASLPALRKFGVGFLASTSWNPVTEQFGALAPICGTILSSLIAMLVGVPLALGVALFLNELCPFRLRPILTLTVELLAAI